ncbi:MAG: hypothetical protein KDD69_13605 [Bdellovibrionales bacterium]|nr:hypothetical protein [Bdellovibrionales bacterium]
MSIPIRPATVLQTVDGRAYLAVSSVEEGDFFHGAGVRIDDLASGARQLDYGARIHAAGAPEGFTAVIDGVDCVVVTRAFKISGEVHFVTDPEDLSSVDEVTSLIRRFELIQLWSADDDGNLLNPLSGFSVRTSNFGKEPKPKEFPEFRTLAPAIAWDDLPKVGRSPRRRVTFHWLGTGLYLWLVPTTRENANDSEREAMGRLVRFDALSANASLSFDRKMRRGESAPGRYSFTRISSREGFVFRLLGKRGPVFCNDDGSVITDADGQACDTVTFGEVPGEANVVDPDSVAYLRWDNPGTAKKEARQGVRIKIGSTAAKGESKDPVEAAKAVVRGAEVTTNSAEETRTEAEATRAEGHGAEVTTDSAEETQTEAEAARAEGHGAEVTTDTAEETQSEAGPVTEA